MAAIRLRNGCGQQIAATSSGYSRPVRSLLAPAIPDWSDRGLRIAGAEAAAVPAVVIEAGPVRAVIHRPIHHLVIVLRALALDHLGRAVAGQKAVAVPVARDVLVRRRLGRGRGRSRRDQREGKSEGDQPSETRSIEDTFLIAPPCMQPLAQIARKQNPGSPDAAKCRVGKAQRARDAKPRNGRVGSARSAP